jgi:hypothetical protein
MDTNIVVGAARRLSIDVANLSFRLAMLDAEREAMTQLVMQLSPGTWRRSMQPVSQERDLVQDPDDTTMVEVEQAVTITGEQIMVLEALLTMFHDPV